MKILLPIKPYYANKILDWEKIFELRKIVPKKQFDTIIIYASAPISKVIWEVKVDEVIKADLSNLWDITKDWSCVDKQSINEYFKWKEIWYAIKVSNPIRYDSPINISKFTRAVPQSFIYIND